MSDLPERVKLKPCPFCGGEAELFPADERTAAMIQCVQCLAIVHGEYDTDAVSVWNRRATCHGTGTVIDEGE